MQKVSVRSRVKWNPTFHNSCNTSGSIFPGNLRSEDPCNFKQSDSHIWSCLTKENYRQHMSKGRHLNRTRWWPDSVNKIFPSSLQTSSTEEAKRMRKLLPRFLKPEALQRYIGIMDTIAQKHFASGWENKEQVVVFPLSKNYILWLAFRLFVSLEDSTQIAKFSDPLELLASGVISIPIDLPGTPFNRAIKASNLIRTELLAIIRQRKDLAEGKASSTKDILSHMLLACEENGKLMNELDIADKILGLLIGGRDTASAVCTFVVKYLAELPYIYDGVYKEQVEIAKSKAAAGELLTWDDTKKMKYSWNVACEVMRISPPLQEYARLEILVFMHDLVKRFKFDTLIQDEKIVVDPLPIPEKGLPVRLHPHKA
ncbi:unnamed protein product [Dovyalis caffra]|uniref:Cytochrome P450 n=1 Tax=Dovyalis caffra TaxID=77055 RepID=A0AAV1S5M2_9ROSI|nr:unnamed protein product [Dovyalis caffra]